MTKKTNKKALVAGCIALAALIIIFAGVYLLTKPQGNEGEKNISITVVHSDLSEKVFDISTDAENLEEVLIEEEIVVNDQGDYGLYILTADGETVDESKSQWWCITKGGETLYTGAADTVIAEGDEYELTFTTGW